MLLALLMLTFSNAFAQNKAQIHVKKNQNGVQSEETREIILSENQNIQDLLIELGILDQLGNLHEGQELEIKIEKSQGEGNNQQLELMFGPAPRANNSLPDFAPAPAMEKKPFLGVMLRENKQEIKTKSGAKGVVITEIVEGTSAEKAEFHEGDIILEIDNNPMSNTRDVIDQIQSHQTGDKVTVLILRDGKEKKIKAKLGEREMEKDINIRGKRTEKDIKTIDDQNFRFRFSPDSITIFSPNASGEDFPNDSMKICQPFSWNSEGMVITETAFLGVTPAEEISTEGVKVNVQEATSAEIMGIQTGDVIISVNGTPVKTFNELADQVTRMKPGDVVKLVVLRDDKQKEISGPIGKKNISGMEDFRIFHDFKGMDEGGNYFYDFEFDMDENDLEDRMQQLLFELDEQRLQLDDERSRIEDEIERLHENSERISIKIQIAEINPEEAANVNKTATPKLSLSNDLAIDEISFFPNPNNGILNLNFKTTEKKAVKVLLYSSRGDIIYLEERSNFDGNYSKTIDISNEPNGSYYLQIVQNGKSYSKKIIKGS